MTIEEKITVVIPLYNKASHIKRALDSALDQSYPADEIIVIDDGSTDGGGDIVKAYPDQRIRYIRQENQGVSAARNYGIALAKGELIALLDADDSWESRYLEIIREMRQRYPDAGAYATAYKTISEEGFTCHHNFPVLPPHAKQGLVDNIFKYIPPIIWTSAVVITKRVFDEIGGFPVGEIWGEDLCTWLKIGIRYPIAWSGEELAIYHRDASNRVDGVKRFSHEPILCRTVREVLKKGLVPDHQIMDLKEFAAYWFYYIARNFIYAKNRRLARELIKETRDTKLYQTQGRINFILTMLPYFIAIPLLSAKKKLTVLRYEVLDKFTVKKERTV